jgi:hypothetical protein
MFFFLQLHHLEPVPAVSRAFCCGSGADDRGRVRRSSDKRAKGTKIRRYKVDLIWISTTFYSETLKSLLKNDKISVLPSTQYSFWNCEVQVIWSNYLFSLKLFYSICYEWSSTVSLIKLFNLQFYINIYDKWTFKTFLKLYPIYFYHH